MTSKLPLPWISPKLDLSLKLSASTAKGMVTGSKTTPNTWRIRRMSKWTKVYLIYMLLMCTLLVFIVAHGYLIPVQLLRLLTRNRSCKMNKDWLRGRWQCVLEVIPRLIRSPSHTPFTFGISVEPKINVIWCLRWAWIWLDHVYSNTVIHLSQRIIITLFTWIIPSMVLHLKEWFIESQS